jgi:predicted amidohydrolase
MRIEPGELHRNLDHALYFIRSAAASGADVVLLPEALPFGWMDPSARALADEIPHGETSRKLAGAAREHGIFVCSGLVEKAGQRLYNSAALFDPAGELILHHRKINELDIAHDLYALGDRLQVADTSKGRIGLMICADAFAPQQSISRTLAMMGAQVILSPCAWAVPPTHDNNATPYGQLWLDNYGPVCRDFGIWIAGCSSVGSLKSGPWAGHRCIGSSLVVGPDGKVWRGRFGVDAEELLLTEVRLETTSRITGSTPESA